MPKLPKPSQETKDFFASVVPNHPAVSIRPMFGQLSASVNGNMFMGIFGEDVFVRLPEDEREELTRVGGGPFEPMAGRPMREYVGPTRGLAGRPGPDPRVGRPIARPRRGAPGEAGIEEGARRVEDPHGMAPALRSFAATRRGYDGAGGERCE